MITDDLAIIAMSAVKMLKLDVEQENYIDGVITMALQFQAVEYEEQLRLADEELADARRKWEAEKLTWDGKKFAINNVASIPVASIPIKALERLMIAVGSSTAFVQTSDYSDCVLWLANLSKQQIPGAVRVEDEPKRIHYGTSSGHLEA